jgi:hypothetical protein
VGGHRSVVWPPLLAPAPPAAASWAARGAGRAAGAGLASGEQPTPSWMISSSHRPLPFTFSSKRRP